MVVQASLSVKFMFADRMRLAAEKGKSNFAHPLGVKPKHRKIVRTFGQVLFLLRRSATSVHRPAAMMSGSGFFDVKLTVWALQ